MQSYSKHPLHIEDVEKGFERFSLFMTKGIPNIIDAGFIAFSIFFQEPKYLAGISIGEVSRYYLNPTYENTKDALKKDIHILEGLVNN